MQGYRIGRLPRKLTDSDTGVSIQLPGPLALFQLCRSISRMDTGLRKNLGLNAPLGTAGAIFVLLRIFKWVYVIKRQDRVVGMMGSGCWRPGEPAFLTMVIWSAQDRSRGTGSAALGLAVRAFCSRGLCTGFIVEVRAGNRKALRFWSRNGFVEKERRNEIIVMALPCA